MNTKTVQKFNPGSAQFWYSLIVAGLASFAIAGIKFPESPADTAEKIVTTMSQGGIWAISGLLITSIGFPLYNYFVNLKGKFKFKVVFSKVSTWVAWGNAALAGIALTGFTIPSGTLEAIIGAVSAKDWMALVSMVALNVGNPLIRFLKDRQKS